MSKTFWHWVAFLILATPWLLIGAAIYGWLGGWR